MSLTTADMKEREGPSSHFMKFVFHKVAIGALLLVYFLVLSVLYEKYISPIHGYRGFTIDRSPYKFGLAIFTIIFVSLAFNVNNKASSMILYFYIVVMLVPQLSFGYNSNGYSYVMVYTTIAFFIMHVVSQMPMRFVNIRNISFRKYHKFLYIFISIVMFYTVYKLGLEHFSFRFDDVYTRREILEQRYDSLLANGIAMCFVFITFLSIINSKNINVQVVIPLLLGLIFFGLTGHKRFALVPIFCIAVYRLVSLDPKYGVYAVILTLLTIGTYYIVFTMEFVNVWENYNALFFTMLFTRTLSIPALLNDLYYDFFSQNGFLYWSYSKIGLGFFQYESTWSPAELIGRHMFTEASANTGMIGSGYMNAGVTGVVIYSVIAGLTLAFVDRVADLRGNRTLYTMLALPSFVVIFTSSDLPSVFFSQGFGIILLMMWLFRIDQEPTQKLESKGSKRAA